MIPSPLQVLKLLKVAWERKLTFTIGTSVTTGAVDTVVWNEIHHKTESNSNHGGHGYPDPHYLDRVVLELVAQGVMEDEEEEEGKDVESSESSDDEGGAATHPRGTGAHPLATGTHPLRTGGHLLGTALGPMGHPMGTGGHHLGPGARPLGTERHPLIDIPGSDDSL